MSGAKPSADPVALAFMQSAALVEAAGQVESDLADTLREMAARTGGEAAARQLKLAEGAAQAAEAAAKRAAGLRQQARRWAEHADVVALHRALGHAIKVLGELRRAEDDVADILNGLADRNGSDLSARRRQQAAEASAAARRAADRAQALLELAKADAAGTQPERIPAAAAATGPKAPGDDPLPRLERESHRLWQDSMAGFKRARDLTVQVLCASASAHDRTAQAHERSASAGIGDVAEHKRRAAFHHAAAEADRQRAEQAREQVVCLAS